MSHHLPRFNQRRYFSVAVNGHPTGEVIGAYDTDTAYDIVETDFRYRDDVPGCTVELVELDGYADPSTAWDLLTHHLHTREDAP